MEKILKFDLVPEVDTPKPGTRDMHRKVRGQQDARQGHNVITWDKQTTEQKQRFKGNGPGPQPAPFIVSEIVVFCLFTTICFSDPFGILPLFKLSIH